VSLEFEINYKSNDMQDIYTSILPQVLIKKLAIGVIRYS